MPLGRKDSKTASYDLVTTNLPNANEGLLTQISKFLYQGLSVTDLVALSGKSRLISFILYGKVYGNVTEYLTLNTPYSLLFCNVIYLTKLLT